MSTANFSNQFKEHLREKFPDRALFDETLAPYLAYQIGGPADVLLFPKNEEELSWVSSFAKENRIPITTIGTGTNLLVHDSGIRGITVSLKHTFREIEIVHEDEKTTRVRCGGGVEKPELLDWAIDRGLGGLLFSSGVPGTIGGGIFMNAGTKYGCYGDILTRLRLFDFEKGPKEFARNEIDFGYREQSMVTHSTLVAWAELELIPKNKEGLVAERDRIIAERAFKQPLDFPSCGSTFKNPEGYSAGRLIEKCGLKGRKVGGAEISTKHANFILNKDKASAQDIMDLIQIVKKEVYSKCGVQLDCEVILVGGPVAQESI